MRSNISISINLAKQKFLVQRTQLKLLKDRFDKELKDERATHASALVVSNLEQLAKTQEYINTLERDGRLSDEALAMAMDQLNDLNNALLRNLQNYENGKSW